MVEQTLKLSPDLIAVTGDLADESVERLKGQTAPLAKLKAPLGIYYVTGNHEYYWNAVEWLAKVRALGWVPLLNENRIISVKGASVFIGGITDSQGEGFLPGHRPDVQAAAKGGAGSSFRLLLSHRPGGMRRLNGWGSNCSFQGTHMAGNFFHGAWSFLLYTATTKI